MHGFTIVSPLKITATFNCNDQVLKKMWTMGCRRIQHATEQICDKRSYNKQLEYTSDTRIQALSSLYLSGDDRLMKKVILDFYLSDLPGYLAKDNNNGDHLKIIPTFSLFWISIIHDYWMHKKDDDFIVQFLPAIQGILDWYERQKRDGQEITGTMSLSREITTSALVSLQYAYTLKQAARLFIAFGDSEIGKRYKDLAEKINDDTMKLCFNNEKALIADRPDKLSYSQHTNIWAVLSGAVEDKKAKKVMIHLLYDKSIEQAPYSCKFYLIQALNKTGLHDRYYAQLRPWQRNPGLMLHNNPEKLQPDYPGHNDWSVQPNYDFLTTICGIKPAAAAFEHVRIQPVLGDLMEIEGTMQHPEGFISVKYERFGRTGIRAEIYIPKTIQGDFIWDGKVFLLRGGKQTIVSSAVRNLAHEY